jgi:NitT/TauT family transport system permease protein/sulfonate transport system permease protein
MPQTTASRYAAPNSAAVRGRNALTPIIASGQVRDMKPMRLLPVLSVGLGLLLWEAIGRLTPPVLFAPASSAVWYLLHTAALPVAIGQSLATLVTGFVLSAVVALPLGFAMGRVWWVREMFHPVLTGLYAIPPVAFIPFLVVWFGLFVESRIAIVVIMSFFEMLTIASTGAAAIDRRLLDVARSFSAPRRRVVTSVLIPASLPFLCTALRIGLVRAVAGTITGELLLSPANLGKLLLDSAARFNTAGILAIVATVALLGLGVQQGLLWLERHVLRWERP